MPTHHTIRRAGLGLTFVRPANPFPLPHSQTVFSWKLYGATDKLAVGARTPGRAGAGSVLSKAGP